MQYYKVVKDGIYDYETGWTTIKNELLTERERKIKFKNLKDNVFKIVEISRKNIYTSFGCRKEKESC